MGKNTVIRKEFFILTLFALMLLCFVSPLAQAADDDINIAVYATPSSGGTVTGGGTYKYGDIVSLHAIANPGWVFEGWYEYSHIRTEELVSTNEWMVFNFAAFSATYEARFSPLPDTQLKQVNIRVQASPSNGGTVSGGGIYTEKDSFQVTATANAGWKFLGWRSWNTDYPGSTTPEINSYANTMNLVADISNYTYEAVFEQTQAAEYMVTLLTNNDAWGEIYGGYMYEGRNHWPAGFGNTPPKDAIPVGARVDIIPEAADGYKLARLDVSNGIKPTSTTLQYGHMQYSFTMPAAEVIVTAVFEPEQSQKVVVTTSVTPANSGTVTGAGTYTPGTEVALTASPKSGWTFSGWYYFNEFVNNNLTTYIQPYSDMAYEARFTQGPADIGTEFNINVTTSPANGGTATGSGKYLLGDTVIFQATPNSGWTFEGWYVYSDSSSTWNQVTTDATYTFVSHYQDGLLPLANWQARFTQTSPQPGNQISGFQVEAISAGAKLRWNPLSGGMGYRVYRSENANSEGISITDFYITSTEFVDVNVRPNTTYYYSVCQVIKEANPLQGLGEELGPQTSKIPIKMAATILGGNIVPPKPDAVKKYILMTIDNPQMNINGVNQEIDPGRGTTPVIISQRTMVPIRTIVESMGGTVGWDDSTRQVSLDYGKYSVRMWLEKYDLIASGVSKKMDVAPAIVNGRTMVPARFSAENLGAEIDWINSTRQVVIVYY